MKKIVVAACAAFFAMVVQLPESLAQSYPVKPIRIVIPYPAGGIDPALRFMVPKMAEVLGQTPFVDNRPGANGLIGADFVARAAPDGYTLLFVAPSTIISGVLLSKDFKLDPLKDFTPVTELFGTKKVLVTHPSLPAGSLREVVEYAKRNPGKISYGSGGIGGTFHMDSEQFKIVTGIDIVHVPYKGTGPYTSRPAGGARAVRHHPFEQCSPAHRQRQASPSGHVRGHSRCRLPGHSHHCRGVSGDGAYWRMDRHVRTAGTACADIETRL